MVQIGRIRKMGRNKHLFAIGIALGLSVLCLSAFNLNKVHAEAVNCDANAVIAGGVSSVSALQQKYADGASCVSGGTTYSNKNYSIQDIYHAFNISPSDVTAMSTDAQSGYVTKSGDVYVNSTLVATGAYTAGRQNIAGSSTHHYGATTFYERSTNVSFQDGQLSAMVVMKNGVFQFAILHSCGNPVAATAVKKATPPPTPTYSCVQLNGAIIDQSQQKYGFTATAKVSGGATFTSADFNFGDGNTIEGVKPAKSGELSVSVTHAYSKVGSYNATAVLHFMANGKAVTAPTCAAMVTPSTPPTPECKPGVPAGSADCSPCPSDSSVPADSAQCTTTPPTLPNTGAGDTIAIFIGVAVAGFLVYRQLIFRRHRAAFVAAERGTSLLPLGDPLSEEDPLRDTPLAPKSKTLRRKRPY